MDVDQILDKAQQILTNIGGTAGIMAGIVIIVVFVFFRQFQRS
jgi:hypothetical protein